MPGGRPTVYKPDYAETARICCTLGATNPVLAERFEVSRSTIDRWIADIPDFRDAVRKGREIADETVASALYSRAIGTRQEVTKAFCHQGKPVTVTYTTELPPDVQACIYWLRNRRPGQWRENRPLESASLEFTELEKASRRVAEPADDERPDDTAARRREADLRELAARLKVYP
jgi:hypothetical protein